MKVRPGDALLTTCHAKTGNPVPEVQVGGCIVIVKLKTSTTSISSQESPISPPVIRVLSFQISFAGETSAPMNFKNSLLVTVPEGQEELEVMMVIKDDESD